MGPAFRPTSSGDCSSPFENRPATQPIRRPGVGLGLALSQRLARDMGGDLRYESGSQGACFALSLPAAV